MKRYIAIDSGKFATKVVEYFPDKKMIRNFPIRTKQSPGDFRDDAIEANTVIIGIDNEVYKVGNGARGAGVALDTNKKTDVHRLCTLTALATLASANETDEINVAIGLPAKDWAIVEKRVEYKDYILPEGEISVDIKKNSTSEVEHKTFVIKNRFVFPESIGALFMDETLPFVNPNSIIGVLDIGNLNLNATLWQGTELVQDKSSTADLGGAILIQELSQEISANITTCDELIAANILKYYSTTGELPDNINLSDEKKEECIALVKRVLRSHAEKIRRCCQARNWSLDLTHIVAIGGTSVDIADELKEVFNNNITILGDATYCNAFGYLRMMCSRLPEINDIIPLKTEKPEKNK